MQLPPARKHVARQSWESLPPDGYINNSRSAPLVFTTSSSFSCYTTSSIDYFIYLLLRLPPLHTMTKAFIALASYHGPFYPDGTNTGVYVSEVLHPYDVFKKHNIDVDFISETGEFEWDPKSIDQILSEEEKKLFMMKTHNSAKPSRKLLRLLKPMEPTTTLLLLLVVTLLSLTSQRTKICRNFSRKSTPKTV